MVPATAPSSVLLPEPLVPTTTTNSPWGTVNVTPSTARTSGPPGAEKVTVAARTSSMAACQEARGDEGGEHDDGRGGLEPVGVEAGAEGGGDEQPEGDAAGDRGQERAAEPDRADERRPQEHARHPPDDHPDPHLHVGEALVLGHEAAADRVIQATARIVRAGDLTALMVTHSLAQAASLGDRLLLVHRGRIALDVAGAAKRRLTADDLADRFDRLRRADQLDDEAARTLAARYA